MLGSELASLKGELFTLMSSCVVKRREGKGPEKKRGEEKVVFLSFLGGKLTNSFQLLRVIFVVRSWFFVFFVWGFRCS